MNNQVNSPKFAIDHVVVAVANLQNSISEFQLTGFHVEPGGVNGPTENALVLFADGTYIELIALRSLGARILVKLLSWSGLLNVLWNRKPNLKLRCLMWFAGKGGLIDWCLGTESLEETIAYLEGQEIEMGSMDEFTRTRPDGKLAEWTLVSSYQKHHPFLIQDISDRSIRVPFENAATHSNGACGIDHVIVNDQDFANKQEQATYFFGDGCDSLRSKDLVGNTRRNQMSLVLKGAVSNNDVIGKSDINIKIA